MARSKLLVGDMSLNIKSGDGVNVRLMYWGFQCGMLHLCWWSKLRCRPCFELRFF